MMRTIIARSPRLCITVILYGALGSQGCIDDRTQIDVSVLGLTPDIHSLQVRMDLNGEPSLGRIPVVQRRLDQFVVKLPGGAAGQLSINVGGREEIGCVVSDGQGELLVEDGAQYQLAITLMRLDKKGCRIDLAIEGEAVGTVVSEPPGLECSVGCQQVERIAPPGETFKLHATADRYSLFSGWSGACEGHDTCEIMVGSEPQRVVANMIPPRACTRERWCLENPPFGEGLRSIWGSSSTDIWVVGDISGPVFHYNGHFFGAAPSGLNGQGYFSEVWGSGPDDVYALAGLDNSWNLVHWNGGAWKEVLDVLLVTTGTDLVGGLWGSGRGNLWAVGGRGRIFHYNGTVGKTENGNTSVFLTGIWGTGPDNIWVVGDRGTILHRDSSQTWSTATSNTGANLSAVWGTGPDNVFAVGNQGVILRWQGSAWAVTPSGSAAGLRALWGSGADQIFAGGEGGTMLRWDGASWRPSPSGTTKSINGLWGTSSTNVWAVAADNTVLRWDGITWTVAVPILAPDLADVWGSGPNDIFAVGAEAGPGGAGAILHWGGARWAPMTGIGTTRALSGIWGSRRNDAWAVGDGGTILHWDGTRWGLVESHTTERLRGVWGSVGGPLWAVGDHGTILCRTGADWERQDGLTDKVLYRVWGSGPRDVWAGGEMGTLLHFDGEGWRRVEIGLMDDIRGISGSGPGDVWIVGANSDAWHLSGGTWSKVPSQESLLLGVWVRGPNDLFVVGGFGALQRWRGQVREPVSRWSHEDLYAIWGQGDVIVAVGANGTILRYRP